MQNMEESQKSEKSNEIPDLYNQPWPEDADNRTLETKQVSCDRENHKFVYQKRANEAKCDCGIGYVLSGGMDLKNGHIYWKDDLVI